MARQTKRNASRRAGLDINCKILTSPEMIQIVGNKFQEHVRYRHLYDIPVNITVHIEVVKHFKNLGKNMDQAFE